VAEKLEEIRSLRVIIEGDRSRCEQLSNELESTRAILRERSTALEVSKNECKRQAEEITKWTALRSELQEKDLQLAEAQETLRRELAERVQLGLKLDQSDVQLERLRETIQERDAELQIVKCETSRLTHVSSALDNTSDTLQQTVRDNEKLKLLYHRLQTDLLESAHTITTLKSSLQREKDEREKQLFEWQRLQNDNEVHKRVVEELRQEVIEKTRLWQQEKEQRIVSEASLHEQRSVSLPLRDENNALKEELTHWRQRLKETEHELEDKTRSLWDSLAVAVASMSEWDDVLDRVVQGNNSNSFNNHNNHSNRKDVSLSLSLSSSRQRSSRWMSSQFTASSPSPLPIPTASSAATTTAAAASSSSSTSSSRDFRSRDARDSKDGALLSLADCDEARHTLSLCLERVSFKVDRLTKIRQLFDATVQKQLEVTEKSLLLSHEKLSSMQQRVQQSAIDLQRVQQLTHRDRERRDRDQLEGQRLRETLLSEHSRVQNEKEERIATLLTELEREKGLQSQSQRRLERNATELETLKETVSTLQRELRRQRNRTTTHFNV
jgi:chromosome segregation ATPase